MLRPVASPLVEVAERAVDEDDEFELLSLPRTERTTFPLEVVLLSESVAEPVELLRLTVELLPEDEPDELLRRLTVEPVLELLEVLRFTEDELLLPLLFTWELLDLEEELPLRFT